MFPLSCRSCSQVKYNLLLCSFHRHHQENKSFNDQATPVYIYHLLVTHKGILWCVALIFHHTLKGWPPYLLTPTLHFHWRLLYEHWHLTLTFKCCQEKIWNLFKLTHALRNSVWVVVLHLHLLCQHTCAANDTFKVFSYIKHHSYWLESVISSTSTCYSHPHMNEQENNSTFLEYKLGKAQHILYIIQKHSENFWDEVHPTQNACMLMLMP